VPPHARAKCEILAARRELILPTNFRSTRWPCVRVSVCELAVLALGFISEFAATGSPAREFRRARVTRGTNRIV